MLPMEPPGNKTVRMEALVIVLVSLLVFLMEQSLQQETQESALSRTIRLFRLLRTKMALLIP
jgi:hypothetical protein